MRIDQDCRALVTGGSSGIGKAIATSLARSGAKVGIVARDPVRLAHAKAAIEAASSKGADVATFAADVSDDAAVAALADAVRRRMGGVDLLVHSAGITHPAAAVDTDLATYRALMATNYFGAVAVTKAFLDEMIARRRGHIVAISSVAGFLGVYGYTGYSASKFALAGFLECLRQEVRPHGIGVTLVFPGDTDTPQLAAENLTKPEPTRVLGANVPVLAPEVVASATLDGVRQNRAEVLPGAHAQGVRLASRIAPSLVRWWMDRAVARVSR